MAKTYVVSAESCCAARSLGWRLVLLVGCASTAGGSACARSSANGAAEAQRPPVAALQLGTSDARPPSSAAREAPRGKLAALSPCSAICARSVELACAQAAECEALCASGMQDGVCISEIKAATECMLREPISHWECSEGLAAIKDGFCEAEQARAAGCMAEAIGTPP